MVSVPVKAGPVSILCNTNKCAALRKILTRDYPPFLVPLLALTAGRAQTINMNVNGMNPAYIAGFEEWKGSGAAMWTATSAIPPALTSVVSEIARP